MLSCTFLAAALLLTASAEAQIRSDREHLLGSWSVEDSNSQETWSLRSEGDTLQVVRTDDGKVTLDLSCRPNGSECQSTDEGKKVKVTMYFNGSDLVQMETKDSYVTTRTFNLEAKTDRMTIDVNPITGPGKRTTLRLTRHLQTAVVTNSPAITGPLARKPSA